MVEYEMMSQKTVVEPLESPKSRWHDLFASLADGEEVLLRGALVELRKHRQAIITSFHWRRSRYPDQWNGYVIRTRLGNVDGQPGLVVTREAK